MVSKSEFKNPNGIPRVKFEGMTEEQFNVVYELVWGSGEYSFTHDPDTPHWIILDGPTPAQVSAVEELLS